MRPSTSRPAFRRRQSRAYNEPPRGSATLVSESSHRSALLRNLSASDSPRPSFRATPRSGPRAAGGTQTTSQQPSSPTLNGGNGDDGDGGDDDDDDDDDVYGESHQVVMALDMKSNGTVGCAFFTPRTATLHLQEDTRITGLELVESLLLQAQPAVVIIPSRAPEKLVDYLDRRARRDASDAGGNENFSAFALRTNVASDFSSEAGEGLLAGLSGLQLGQPRSALFTTATEEAGEYTAHREEARSHLPRVTKQNDLMHLGSHINLDSRLSLGCVCALIHCMFVTADTLFALQIIRPDGRQGVGRRGGPDTIGSTARNQCSVFDLFRPFALTPQGRVRLREIFLQPSVDLSVINERHEAISSLLCPQNTDTLASIRTPLEKIQREELTRPRAGYLVVATADPGAERGSGQSNCHINEETDFDVWEEVFQEDGLLYFKTHELRHIDKTFGDLDGRIIQFFHQLGSEILEHESKLLLASEAVGEIDSIVALAAGAKKFQLNRPQMTSSNILDIHNGRHILQELRLGSFVPNDCKLAGGSGHALDEDDNNSYFGAWDLVQKEHKNEKNSTVLALTGPNHSGKSVYLKQVAIIVYLAHVGSFVPAEEAVIGLTDRILSRIATRESVSRDESAFGVDLRQAAFLINFATRRSLVLIDEFGKGTDAVDGAALLDALLWHFLHLGQEDAPMVLAATHSHEIFESGVFHTHPRFDLAHMGVTVSADRSQPDSGVTFFYKLQKGRNAESFGCHCAAINGVDPDVVERARRIANSLTQGASLEKICLDRSGNEMDGLQEDEMRARRFLAEMGESGDVRSSWETARGLLAYSLDDRGNRSENTLRRV
ncbi:adenylyl-sulfate kinase [Niveomyces insectorum RCEF 264]|uniref:DNA mismatch repair protein MSH5 n=1 Tax=Niveomyces insectorum RCEF 264 TaxID=1081102 RepID=A0A167U121_9HYPO|nr:adenylyl-sulfate kinase [Niveomyces insectorum RCEF 264]